ncbi:MAG: class I tRNA ligase family protein, partial [Candidatus Levyibacteriota bacterium]
KYCKAFVLLLAPFAPHMSEELHQNVILNESEGSRDSSAVPQNDKSFKSIHLEPWPTYDEKSLEESDVSITVSVNGKTRDVIKVKKSKVKSQKSVEQLAMESANVKKYLEGQKIQKTIYVEGKIINFVIQ